MTNKQALREEFRNMQDHYSDPADRKRQEIYIAAEALLDELEAKDRRNAELNSIMERWAVDRAQSASDLDDAEKRIAELEAREVKVRQFSEFQICHFGASEDYAKGYIDCQKNYNKALGAANILVSINGEG